MRIQLFAAGGLANGPGSAAPGISSGVCGLQPIESKGTTWLRCCAAVKINSLSKHVIVLNGLLIV
jgi:hypothetical protein